MTRKEIIAAIKAVYPGFTAPDYAKAHNPDYYGIMLTPGARAIERGALFALKRKRTETRNKLTWRADRVLFERVQRAKQQTGIATTQELLTVAIIRYLDEVEA